MGAIPSSPEPDGQTPLDTATSLLSQKPIKMASMMRLARVINDCTVEDKLSLLENGIVQRLIDMISERSGLDHSQTADQTANDSNKNKGKKGRGKSASASRGVGYGFGSTRSRWDREKAVEEQLVREEQLVWLLNALTAYLYCASPDFGDQQHVVDKAQHNHTHINHKLCNALHSSQIIPLFHYHLKNESVFDVSDHLELYQALFETCCSMTLYSSLATLVFCADTNSHFPDGPESSNPAPSSSEQASNSALSVPLLNPSGTLFSLLAKFTIVVESYTKMNMTNAGSPDFRLVDFQNKLDAWTELLVVSAEQHNLVNEPVRAGLRQSKRYSELSQEMDENKENEEGAVAEEVALTPLTLDESYVRALKSLHIQSVKFIGDYGKLVIPYSFRKEARNLNPFSPASKDRTKRIAKELAALSTALPLGYSNSIFVCVDESRCDIMKVMITGPDGTPYQCGLFEFDVFFPSSYPFSPPKVLLVTTGNGTVRFNPNLYADGKICLSILGTWDGRPEEKWTPYCSLLQVLVSIQALIFVREPYYNEPGYERLSGTPKGLDYSRFYNQQVEQATMQFAIREQILSPPAHFEDVIRHHVWVKRQQIIELAGKWLKDVLATPDADKRLTDWSVSSQGVNAIAHRERAINLLIEDLTMMHCPPALKHDSKLKHLLTVTKNESSSKALTIAPKFRPYSSTSKAKTAPQATSEKTEGDETAVTPTASKTEE